MMFEMKKEKFKKHKCKIVLWILIIILIIIAILSYNGLLFFTSEALSKKLWDRGLIEYSTTSSSLELQSITPILGFSCSFLTSLSRASKYNKIIAIISLFFKRLPYNN